MCIFYRPDVTVKSSIKFRKFLLMQECWKLVSANCIACVISWSQTIYIYIFIYIYIYYIYIYFILISYSLDTQVMLILILIYVQYWQKAVLSFEKGSNRQNHSSSGSLHPVKYSPSKISDSPQPLNAIWKTPIYKTLWPLFVYGVQLLQGYTEPLWEGSLFFT